LRNCNNNAIEWNDAYIDTVRSDVYFVSCTSASSCLFMQKDIIGHEDLHLYSILFAFTRTMWQKNILIVGHHIISSRIVYFLRTFVWMYMYMVITYTFLQYVFVYTISYIIICNATLRTVNIYYVECRQITNFVYTTQLCKTNSSDIFIYSSNIFDRPKATTVIMIQIV
jgi:hypothetical protein